MSALDNPDLARPDRPPAGAVAVANEEAVRAWDTVLYERWKSNRKVFVGALSGVTEQAFELYPPPEHGRCIDIGCGFGEATQRLAELVGPAGFALGTDSSPRFIEDARREAGEAAGCDGIELHQRDFDYFMGADMDEAIESLLAIGPGAELIRLNGDYGESRRDEIAEALRDHYAAWQRPDGSIVGRGSVWIVAATNRG